MQIGAAFVAIVPQRRGVLDRQDMATRHQALGMGTSRGDHFARRDRLAPQEPSEPNLPGAVTAKRTHADAGLPHLHQTRQQVDPNRKPAGVTEAAKRRGASERFPICLAPIESRHGDSRKRKNVCIC